MWSCLTFKKEINVIRKNKLSQRNCAKNWSQEKRCNFMVERFFSSSNNNNKTIFFVYAWLTSTEGLWHSNFSKKHLFSIGYQLKQSTRCISQHCFNITGNESCSSKKANGRKAKQRKTMKIRKKKWFSLVPQQYTTEHRQSFPCAVFYVFFTFSTIFCFLH